MQSCLCCQEANMGCNRVYAKGKYVNYGRMIAFGKDAAQKHPSVHQRLQKPFSMMSSTDSISTVLKCMVKGAADFLIKPVRKNELRNMWQHVWRKKIGIADSTCRDACNMQNDERHEECVEMVERSFMSKSKQLANMSSSGMGTSSGIGPSSSADISSEEDTLCAEPKAMDTEVRQGYQGKNTCTVDEADCRLNELYSMPCTEAFDLIGKFENCLADLLLS